VSNVLPAVTGLSLSTDLAYRLAQHAHEAHGAYADENLPCHAEGLRHLHRLGRTQKAVIAAAEPGTVAAHVDGLKRGAVVRFYEKRWG
jgi:hypothetical protein